MNATRDLAAHGKASDVPVARARRRYADTLFAVVLIVLAGACLGRATAAISGLPSKWLIVLALAGLFPVLCILVGSLRRTLEGLLILSFLMHVDAYLGFSDKYENLNPGTPLTWTGLLLLGLYALWAWRLYRREDSLRLFPAATLPLAVIAAWAALSLLWAPEPAVTRFHLFGLVEVLAILLYAANMVKSLRDIRCIVTAVTIAVAVTGVVVLAQYCADSTFGLEFLGAADAATTSEYQQTYSSMGISRVSGFLDNANTLAWVLKLWLPLLLLWAVASTEGNARRWICLTTFLLGLVALVLTFSRGGWLAFFFSLCAGAVLLFHHRRRPLVRHAARRLVPLGLLAAAAIACFLPKITARLLHDDFGAAHSRIPMAQVALNVISHHPLTGVGYGNYIYVMHEYDNTPERITEYFPHPVHNVYLLLAADLGLGALVLLALILVVVLRAGLRALRSVDPAVFLFALGLLAGLAGAFLHGMLEQGPLGFWKLDPIWFMAGLLLALAARRNESWT